MVQIKALLAGLVGVSLCMADISGIVTDTGTTPIAGVVVQLMGGPTATTGADGRFTLVESTSGVLHGKSMALSNGLSARISNNILTMTVAERSALEITTFNLNGKSLSTVSKTLDAGSHSLSLPYRGAGIYLYKVKSGNKELLLKGNSVGGVSSGSAILSQGSSSNPPSKKAISAAAAINYVIAATKSGYMSYRMILTTADTSGIDIKMQVGTGLVLVGLQRTIVMKNIPAGTFTMGSSDTNDYGAQPPFQVTLSAFAMQETDVTQEQYLAVTGTNPSYFDTGTGALLRPVEQVSWYDAVKYCNALSLISGLTAVYDTSAGTADFSQTGYRLPTEAQWEYACRAGSITEYWWGPDTNGMGASTWSYNDSVETTQPVATKLANAYGLYDMTGNVWQWCNDWYGSYTAAAATDPAGATTGTSRVLRGGSWNNYYNRGGVVFRSAYRYNFLPDYGVSDVGFRVVLPR